MRELLKSVVDMHIHGTPSIAHRVDTWDFLREMDKYGYLAVGLKEHFIPTTGIASIINSSPNNLRTRVMGSLVLNNACGGLNLTAVETAYSLGARQIYFPTVSARNHCEYIKTVSSFGGGVLSVPENPIYILNNNGTLIDDVLPIISYVKKHPDIVLSMGHMSTEEIDALIDYAACNSVRKIMVDHPYFIINATTSQVEKWAKKGVYINFTCSSLKGIGKNGHTELSVLEKTLALVPEDRIVISTDFGQPYNGSPVEGMYKMIQILIKELMVPEQMVIKMTSSTPARLLGLQ